MIESPTSLTARDLSLAILVVLIWGLGFVPTKYALNDFTPFQLGAARFLLLAFPLILFIPRPGIPPYWLVLYGFTQGVGQFSLLFFALKAGMTAALASVLMQTQIFITAVLAMTILGETISRSLKLGMGIASLGLICFALNVSALTGLSTITAPSLILTLMAAYMWASSNIIVKKIQKTGLVYSPLSLVVWSSLVSGMSFVVISLQFDSQSVRWNWLNASVESWISVLYLGWIASGLAYCLWTVLLTRYPASSVAPFSLGIPVIGLLAGIIVLNEQVTAVQWLGSILVISALVFVILNSLRSYRRLSEKYARNR